MVFSIKSLFKPDRAAGGVYRLYDEIVRQARTPAFFGAGRTPDTPEGRFAMIALHAFLVMDRLGREEDEGELSQALFDSMFEDMDRNLRELGVGDLSVGKKVKALARKFYAAAAALRNGLNEDDAILSAALQDDLLDGAIDDPRVLDNLTAYMRSSVVALSEQTAADLGRGEIHFPVPLITVDK